MAQFLISFMISQQVLNFRRRLINSPLYPGDEYSKRDMSNLTVFNFKNPQVFIPDFERPVSHFQSLFPLKQCHSISAFYPGAA